MWWPAIDSQLPLCESQPPFTWLAVNIDLFNQSQS
jgi:hypothetical protein